MKQKSHLSCVFISSHNSLVEKKKSKARMQSIFEPKRRNTMKFSLVLNLVPGCKIKALYLVKFPEDIKLSLLSDYRCILWIHGIQFINEEIAVKKMNQAGLGRPFVSNINDECVCRFFGKYQNLKLRDKLHESWRFKPIVIRKLFPERRIGVKHCLYLRGSYVSLKRDY